MPSDSDVPWDLVSIVRRSRLKSEIVFLLDEEPQCASTIAEKVGYETETISNHFRDLKTSDPPIIECKTPDQPHHRLYDLTEVGEAVKEHVAV